MELALAIQDRRQLSLLENYKNMQQLSSIEQQTLMLIENELLEKYNLQAPQRIYFGSEFCQYRIPTLEDVQKAYEIVTGYGYEFSFVTSYVPESGMQQLLTIFSWLNQQETGVEVVVNDWGICYSIAKNYPNLIIVVGRLLNKMIRDPRVAHLYNQKAAPQKAKSIFMNSAFEAPYFQQFLQRYNVSRIEYDSFIQPIQQTKEREGMPSSLYLGYGVIATGRSCLVGTLHKPSEEKFKGDVQCKQQCTKYVAQMHNTRPTLGQLPVKTMQKGNTAFYQQDEELMRKGLEWANEMNVSRIIISPKIPV